jgi:hypothetical protein
MKLRGIDILRDIDLAAISFLALSASSRDDAPQIVIARAAARHARTPSQADRTP